jgi:hypothetical protein
MIGLAVVAYFMVGGVLGVAGGWELTASRSRRYAPAVDIALGAVVLVIGLAWPAWIIGWELYSRRYEPNQPQALVMARVGAGAGVIAAIAITMWSGT